MKAAPQAKPFVVQLEGDNLHLANLCGPLDENLRQIADGWHVNMARRGSRVTITGPRAAAAAQALQWFHAQAAHQALSVDDIQLGMAELGAGRHDGALDADAVTSALMSAGGRDDVSHSLTAPQGVNVASTGKVNRGNPQQEPKASPSRGGEDPSPGSGFFTLRTRRSDLRPRTPRQRDYLTQMLRHDITFGIGPAGTGKTWLAVACAIDALERESVQRLVLTRPAVEAGERLGFLPGDLVQKVDPYLRPLYDALYDLMGFERVQRLFDKQTIEIAPLAYMRGRTLNHAFVILDEAQNTTPEQMKMFLTRIGFGSKAVINGDPSQIDLPKGQRSGLAHAVDVLASVQGIAITRFTSRDVVRHPLVACIVEAYEAAGDA